MIVTDHNISFSIQVKLDLLSYGRPESDMSF